MIFLNSKLKDEEKMKKKKQTKSQFKHRKIQKKRDNEINKMRRMIFLSRIEKKLEIIFFSIFFVFFFSEFTAQICYAFMSETGTRICSAKIMVRSEFQSYCMDVNWFLHHFRLFVELVWLSLAMDLTLCIQYWPL